MWKMKLPFLGSKLLQNEKGMALVMVLLIVTVLSILGVGLLGLSLNNVKLTDVDRKYESAYYIAEAGLSLAVAELKKDIKESQNTTSDEAFFRDLETTSLILNATKSGPYTFENQFSPAYGEEPNAKIAVISKTENKIVEDKVVKISKVFKIASVGWIGNEKRTVTESITIKGPLFAGSGANPGETDPGGSNPDEGENDPGGISPSVPVLPGNAAVFTNAKITLVGGASIQGDAGTNYNGSSSVELNGGASIAGAVYVLKGYEKNAVNVPHYMTPPVVIPMQSRLEIVLPSFPDFPVLAMAPNAQVQRDGQTYNVIQDGNLRVDDWRAADYTLQLKENTAFNNITLNSNYTLNIDTGDSDKIIVVNHLDVKNGHIQIVGSGKLTMYVMDDITIGAGSTINGNTKNVSKLSLYLKGSSPSKTMRLNGDQKIYGSLYAQNANISINGGGGFQGHIFTGGSEVKMNGGARAYSTLIFAPRAAFDMSGGAQIRGAVVANEFSGSGGAIVLKDKVDFSAIPFLEGPADLPNPGEQDQNQEEQDQGSGFGLIERGVIRES